MAGGRRGRRGGRRGGRLGGPPRTGDAGQQGGAVQEMRPTEDQGGRDSEPPRGEGTSRQGLGQASRLGGGSEGAVGDDEGSNPCEVKAAVGDTKGKVEATGGGASTHTVSPDGDQMRGEGGLKDAIFPHGERVPAAQEAVRGQALRAGGQMEAARDEGKGGRSELVGPGGRDGQMEAECGAIAAEVLHRASCGADGSSGRHHGDHNVEGHQERIKLGGPEPSPHRRGVAAAQEVASGGGSATSPVPRGGGGNRDADSFRRQGEEEAVAVGRLAGRAATPDRKKWTAAPAAPVSTLLPRSCFLIDAVLSWTIDDILDDNKYKNQVKPIPDKFESAENFIDLYSRILVEETRSIISSALQNLKKHNCCPLHSASLCESPSTFYLDIDLDMARSDSIKCQSIAKDLDMCVLTSTSPLESRVDKMQRCFLGLVVGVGRDSSFQRSFRLIVSNDKQFNPESIKFVSFLTNINHNIEIAKALDDDSVVRSMLNLYTMVGKKCNICPALPHNKDKEDIVPNLISRISCCHQYHTEVILASAGTLTNSFVALVEHFVNTKRRVLICVPRETRILECLTDIEKCMTHSDRLSGILVVNDGRALKNSSKVLEKCLMENKCHELCHCLRATRYWMKTLMSLLDLSGFCHLPRCSDDEKCKQCKNLKLHSFSIIMFTDRFTDIKIPVWNVLVYLVNNVSPLGLSNEDEANIVKLLHLMDEFEALLEDKHLLRDDCLEEAFKLRATAVVAEESAHHTARSLNETRTECIRLIIEVRKKKSLLPDLKDRDVVEKFCIRHSQIIITSLDHTWKLHGAELDTFDALIVNGANQIKDCELLIPLVLPVRHIILFGDHHHIRPSVHSKICTEAGFGGSIFGRLQQQASEKQRLTHQFVRHPLVNEFISDRFYRGQIKDAPNVTSVEFNKEFESMRLPIFSFMDVPAMESIQLRKGDINYAAIFNLLQLLREDLKDVNGEVHIGVLCLSNNEANAVAVQLRSMNETNKNFNLQVKYIGNLEGDFFDVVIIPTIAEDNAELSCVSENCLYAALTSSRHCFLVVGKCRTLVQSGGIWNDLIKHVRKLGSLQMMDRGKLVDILKKFETHGADRFSDPDDALPSKMIGQEFTWADRPIGKKYILADVRDQSEQPDTCTMQSSCGALESLMKLHSALLTPPQDWEWNCIVDDLKEKYEESVGKELRSEDIADRGVKRLVTALEKLKDDGVIVKNKDRTKVLKISGYEKVQLDTDNVKKLLEEGNIMVGHFRLSTNYFNPRPGEVYVYDEKRAILHPNSKLSASHAVMIIAIGHRLTVREKFFRHMGTQNSEGTLFEINGRGRVSKKTVEGLYRMTICKPQFEEIWCADPAAGAGPSLADG